MDDSDNYISIIENESDTYAVYVYHTYHTNCIDSLFVMKMSTVSYEEKYK